MIKRWKILNIASKNFFNGLKDFNPIIAQILYNRNITKKNQIRLFLHPDFDKDLADPFLLKGMKKSVVRIARSISKKEKILIISHFDADGVCAAALAYKAFEFLNVKNEVYILDRKNGYDLSQKEIDGFSKNNFKLIITLDYGISNHKAALHTKNKKIDYIITDHHQIPKKLPKAYSIIDPLLPGDSFPDKYLSGTGIVFKLLQALFRYLKIDTKKQNHFLKWNLDLVALASIGDIVPLILENRILTKYGLKVLNRTKNYGIREICKKAGFQPSEINTYKVGFIIVPRINASGRMDHANASFFLLVEKDLEKIEKLADILEKHNSNRKQKLNQALELARKKIERESLSKNKIILISHKKWPEGILGLIAGKLTDELNKPVIALKKGNLYSKGSARSIEAFDITSALKEFENILERVGGHKRAAGLTIKTKLMSDLFDKLIQYSNKKISDESLLKTIEVDAEINFKQITKSLYQELKLFEPYGYKNPKPIFLSRNLKILDLKRIGNTYPHLDIKLLGGTIKMRAIGFGLGKMIKKIKKGDIINLCYNIQLNQWNGQEKLELKIIDFEVLNKKIN